MTDNPPLKLYLLLFLVGLAALWAVSVIGNPGPRHHYEAERLTYEEGEFETTNLATGAEGGDDTYDVFGWNDEVYYCQAVDSPACILLTETAPDNETLLTNTTADPPPLETRADLFANYVYDDEQFYRVYVDTSTAGIRDNVTLARIPAREALLGIATERYSEAHLTAIQEGSVTTDTPLAHEGELLVYDGQLYRIHEVRVPFIDEERNVALRTLQSALIGVLGALSTFFGGGGLLLNWRKIRDEPGLSAFADF